MPNLANNSHPDTHGNISEYWSCDEDSLGPAVMSISIKIELLKPLQGGSASQAFLHKGFGPTEFFRLRRNVRSDFHRGFDLPVISPPCVGTYYATDCIGVVGSGVIAWDTILILLVDIRLERHNTIAGQA
jgi:hypothetical protein